MPLIRVALWEHLLIEWEGSDLPVLISVVGAASGRLRELRDPCVFQDVDGQVYLLYSAAGESAIGIVKLNDI